MIQTYNGPLNKSFLRELKKQCNGIQKSRAQLLAELQQKGTLRLATNLDLFGGIDFASRIHTLESKKDVQNFMNDRIREKLDAMIHLFHVSGKDPFTNMLIGFVLGNGGRFPNFKQLTELYKIAEALWQAIPAEDKPKTRDLSPLEFLLKECLILAEELMERARVTSPKLVHGPYQPYFPDWFSASTDELSIVIKWDRHESQRDSSDYSIVVRKRHEQDFRKEREIRIHYTYYTDSAEYVIVHDNIYDDDDPVDYSDDDEFALSTLIELHKILCEKAKAAGFEFKSEVNYENITLETEED